MLVERERVKPDKAAADGGAVDDVALRDDVRVLATRCPFCHEDVAPDAVELAVCGGCMARHHDACWSERRACGACGQTRRLVPAPSLSDDEVTELLRQGWPKAAVSALRDRGLDDGHAGGAAFRLAARALAQDRSDARTRFMASLAVRAALVALGGILCVTVATGVGLTVGALGLLSMGAFIGERGPLRRLAWAELAIGVVAVLVSATLVELDLRRGLGLGHLCGGQLALGLCVASAQAILVGLAAVQGRLGKPPS